MDPFTAWRIWAEAAWVSAHEFGRAYRLMAWPVD